MAQDWSNQIKSLMESPLGKELVRTLRDNLAASIIEDAQKAESAESAYGLIKESRGVIKAIEHLSSISSFADKE